MPKVKCLLCQKQFESKRSTAKFCSANCRVKWNNQILNPKPANASAFDGSHVNLIKQDESLQFQEAYPPLPKGMKMLMIPKDQVIFPWIKLITDYCQEKGIVPEDLITFYKKYSNIKTGTAFTDEKGKVNKVVINELKAPGAKDYNPNDNPLYKLKNGIK